MFDKLKFNNLIISGSKEIQKAKIQVLRKIIQKIQKLKKTVDKHPQDESSKIKLRKCLTVVESAKKLKKFEALTNILLLEKCPNKIVTNSHSTPDEVAIAMLATNAIMKTFLAKMRQELSLNEADGETWRKTLVQISKQKIKTQRRKKKKLALQAAAAGAEGAPTKQKSKNIKKKAKKLKVPAVNENDMSLKSLEASAEDGSLPEKVSSETFDNKIDNKTAKLKAEMKTPKIKAQKATFELTKHAKTADEISLTKTETRKIIKPKLSNAFADEQDNPPAAKQINKSKNAFAVEEENPPAAKQINKPKPKNAFAVEEDKPATDFKDFNTEFKTNAKSKPKFSQPEIKVAKVVDPFFMTSTGESYVAIAPVIETNTTSTENNFSFNVPKRNTNQGYKTFKADNRQLHADSSEKYKRHTDSKEKHKNFKPENEKLHPSWLAKQKQRPTLVDFKGKRKVFGDDTTTIPIVEQKPSSTNNKAANDLHPSWLAKQKLKPTITAFQGKKIKFDDA